MSKLILLRLDWQDGANCRGADAEEFFPNKGESTAEAKKLCRRCDVKAECLNYAITTNQEYGVWGGLSERERRAEKRRGAGAQVAA